MPLFRRKRDEPLDPNERSPQLGIKYKDLAVLDQLVKAGANLDEPRHVLHYLYYPSETAARAAAALAEGSGYEVEVRPPIGQRPDEWALVCEKHGVVTDAETVRSASDFFDDLAAQNLGEYDGWEASV